MSLTTKFVSSRVKGTVSLGCSMVFPCLPPKVSERQDPAREEQIPEGELPSQRCESVNPVFSK